MKSGFSFIELLVVVAIIGVLAVIGIVGYQAYIKTVKTDVAVINGEQLNRLMANDLFSINNKVSARTDFFAGSGLNEGSQCWEFANQMVIKAQSAFGGAEDSNPITDSNIAINGYDLESNANYPNEEPIGDQIVIFCNNRAALPQDDDFVIRTCVCDYPTNTDSINGNSCAWTPTCPQPW